MNRLQNEIETPMGHAFFMDVLARNKTPVRTLDECEEIVDEHAELTGRPQAKSERTKPINPSLAAKRRSGRRAWEATGRGAVYANN